MSVESGMQTSQSIQSNISSGMSEDEDTKKSRKKLDKKKDGIHELTEEQLDAPVDIIL